MPKNPNLNTRTAAEVPNAEVIPFFLTVRVTVSQIPQDMFMSDSTSFLLKSVLIWMINYMVPLHMVYNKRFKTNGKTKSPMEKSHEENQHTVWKQYMQIPAILPILTYFGTRGIHK